MSGLCIRHITRLALLSPCRQQLCRALIANNSSRHQGNLAKVREWSSPELAAVAESIRTKIILPRRLNKAQRRLVFGSKYKERLENEPIYATVGGQEIRLQHLNVTKDIPRTWQAINRVFLLAKDEKDYQNVIRMLEDFKLAGISLKSQWFVKLARYLISKGFMPLLLQALKKVEYTNMSLSHRELLHNVLFGVRKKAESSSWNIDVVRSCLRDVEEVMAMLENPLHGGGRKLMAQDARTSPEVYGFVAELTSVLNRDIEDDSTFCGKATTYTGRLLSMFDDQEGNQSYQVSLDDKDHREIQTYMKLWIPAYQALALSMKDQLTNTLEATKVSNITKALHEKLSEADALLTDWFRQELPKSDVESIESIHSWRHRMQ